MLNERQIEAFRATARLGTVTAAAESLHITQPAVSRLLSHLEARIGIGLFERNKKRLKLTAEGKVFLAEVDQHFVGLDRLRKAAQRIGAHGTGSLRAIGFPSITSGILPQAIMQLLADYPRTMITLDTDTTDRIAPQIANGAYDVGFSTHPVPSSDAVDSKVLASRPWTCVFPPDHPNAGRETIFLSELSGQSLIGFSPGMSLRERVDREFDTASLSVEYILNAQTIESICALVAAGCGAAVIHPFAIHVARMHGLTTTVIEEIAPLDLVVVTPLDQGPSVLVDAFVQESARLVQME